jgi:hypothetical protein
MHVFENLNCNNIFLIENRNWWNVCKNKFNKDFDVVLTYDFGLFLEINSINGRAFYIDSLVSNIEMQKNNFLFYDFFKKWHHDSEQKDIFVFKGIQFGFALRLEIWNDLTFYIRNRICLEKIRSINYSNIYLGSEVIILSEILDELNLNYKNLNEPTSNIASYFFPIHKWLDEKVRYKGISGLKYKIRDLASLFQSLLITVYDKIFTNYDQRPLVFIQEYHPTRQIVKNISKRTNFRVLLATFSRTIGYFRYVPVYRKGINYTKESINLLKDFENRKFNKIILSNNIDITEKMYSIILNRIADRLPDYLLNLDCIINYLKFENLKLIVLVTNIGKNATLIDCFGKAKGIPTYLVINGYMSGDFLDESKYANYINSYSSSIKHNYFKSVENVYPLGDPRMDFYSGIQKKKINRIDPIITIGASAHSIIDLNSFLAVEFEFLYEVLQSIRNSINNDFKIRKVIIKTRANGYLRQYRDFINEYFCDLPIEILSDISMAEVFISTDLYISLYSQTHFEASCFGIPCIYYKNDKEIIDPPFDFKSELVTVDNISDLEKAILDFANGSTIFDDFLKKSVLEKYIGPLDGKNLDRNIEFITKLINSN